MKRYFDLKDFICFLNLLEENKPVKLYSESVEDGNVEAFDFSKINFAGELVVLYEIYSGGIGIIQDSPVAPWEDYAEGVFEDITREGEYKVFISSLWYKK